MRVNIGNYRTWHVCQIHYDYMNRKYDYNWDESTTTFERYLEKFEGIVQKFYNLTINQIYKRVPRKMDVKVHPWDVYSADHTLALIIHPTLVKLKEQNHGYFMVADEDVPDELARPDDYDWAKGDDIDIKRYEYVMDEMIWAFEQKLRGDWESDYYEFEEVEKREDGTFSERFGIKFSNRDPEGMKKHHLRMKNGFRLFGKYYEALWD